MPTAITILLWDIDGTLLLTGRAGIIAWKDAAKELTGVDVDVLALGTAGVTDFEIARRILDSVGKPADPAAVARLVRRYEALLPWALPQRTGRVLEGVREALESLQDRPDVRSFLLTGNTRAGARAKLTYYNLAQFFPDGGFSEDASDRPSIARQAVVSAARHCTVCEGRVFVIGDTPHDIHCGQAIGARTLAVASGDFPVEALERHSPWLVVRRIPPPAEFLALLDLPAEAVAQADLPQ